MAWCRAHYVAKSGMPRFRREAFLNRNQGFGLWSVVETDLVAGARENGACEGVIRARTLALLPGGETDVIGAARRAFGVESPGEETLSADGWPSHLIAGPSSIVGAPVIIRLMRRKPSAAADEATETTEAAEGADDASAGAPNPGDLKVTIGLFEAEA